MWTVETEASPARPAREDERRLRACRGRRCDAQRGGEGGPVRGSFPRILPEGGADESGEPPWCIRPDDLDRRRLEPAVHVDELERPFGLKGEPARSQQAIRNCQRILVRLFGNRPGEALRRSIVRHRTVDHGGDAIEH